MSDALEHRRLRAPRENGATLVNPPLSGVGDLLEQNVALAGSYDYDVQGRALCDLALAARRELVEAAWNYTRAYRDVPQPVIGPTMRVFLAGHQPHLFHPGVWFKNFALSHMAARHGAVAVNLAIDSDTIKTASLRVPAGTPGEPWVESVPLDRQTAEIPYEERSIVDRECLASFGQRASKIIKPLVPQPLLGEFWSLVAERARHGGNLGECVAQARHQQEGRWGAVTLEIPQSQVCSLPAFHWFTCHLLARLPRLWEEYNRSVADYRKAHHVRSTAHPVPDLAMEDGWLEAPFWIWDRANPRRRRLFVRQRGDEIVLSDRLGLEHALLLSPESDAQRAVEQLLQLAADGIRLRTRALITTLFARLFLGDIFLHGIGGAKYDQVTDLVISRFFGIEPAGYMTLTATLRLPIARDEVRPDDARGVDHDLRELTFHPERYLDNASDARAELLLRTKQQWIATPASRENAKLRCHEIRRVNEELQPWLAQERGRLTYQREQIARALRAQSILTSREYAFCLYPAESLRQLMEMPQSGK
ncbi:MAG: hypothetical protein HY288_08825 [Planctomycetia bacterium]|nr:hypothetical protein [Planctomycetia bacterium]